MTKKRNKNYKKHQVIGGWKLQHRLGTGGNGEVWCAQKDNNIGAIKLLKKIELNTYKRFKSEVHAISSNQNISGVIRIVDQHLPEGITSDIPWFVMPVCIRFSEWRKGRNILDVMREMSSLGKTLQELHDNEYYHRDIKPANILFHDERLNLSDFGLVKYPNSNNFTGKREDVGPKFTMAPEMRRNASGANGELADIYSFAKTLWIAITGDMKCFDGQYNVLSTVSINHHCEGLYTKTLNDLLAQCTEHTPESRPKMVEVIERLDEWIKINEDFHSQNLTEWFDLQNRIFPAGAPKSVTWVDKNSILAILNEIAHVSSLNHTFLPDGGGNTFIDAIPANEEDFIALKITNKWYYTFKPKKLTYESFGVDAQWNYFRLEIETTQRTDVYGANKYDYSFEEVVEIEQNVYVERSCWDENEYKGEILPKTAKLLCRYIKGCFVIFSTRSIYNRVSETYDGRHNTMKEGEFRDYIESNARSHKKS